MTGPDAPPRLYIDARMLGEGGTGVSTYARTLVAATSLLGRPYGLLRGEPALGRSARFARAIFPGYQRLSQDGTDLVGADIFRIAQSHFNIYGRVLRLRAAGPPGVMHWTYPVPLMMEGWSNLYTIHDLIPLLSPHLTPIKPERHRRLLAALDRVADRFVTVSEATRDDILTVLGFAPERIVNCGQAVVLETAADHLPEGCEAGGYLLFAGRIEFRKNLGRLIEAHAQSGTQMQLLLVGPLAEGGEDILVAGIRANARVRYLPYVDRATLLALIANARALLLPSLAEGFGLPVAEAMTMGTPTLISRDPALHETGGGAALVVDGEDQNMMADAIRLLACDDDLCAYLIARGLKRAKSFTVSRFAARLGDLYAGVEAQI